VQVAARLAVARGVDLVLTPAGRPCITLAAELTKRGVPASAAEQPDGALVVVADTGGEATAGGDGEGDAHLAVLGGSNEFSDDLDQWVQALEGAGSMKAGSRE
jgi:predicted amidohydrolase